MQRSHKLILGLVAFVSLSGAVVAGVMHKHGQTPEQHANAVVEKLNDKLELNQQQQIQLNQLKDEILRVHYDLHGDKVAHMDKVMSLIKEPTFNQGTALDLVNQKTRYVNDNAPAVITALGNFYDSLNPKQQQSLREKIQEHKERHHRF
ncbi:MAG: Spy/CpxP family protein refolding chaperone [Gammaproteobacteria bacterium]|nr:Spy/CpxP family protein refolding chaperone [Gammaproteobacteria bacterium]MDH5802328.1 Spy/CpxP family protein refolding chaperone [Gammaproteobacteria bacterium]